jgi:hypothetical protein
MKVRKDVEVVVKDGTFYVLLPEGSLVDYGPAEPGEPLVGWFIEMDLPEELP